MSVKSKLRTFKQHITSTYAGKSKANPKSTEWFISNDLWLKGIVEKLMHRILFCNRIMIFWIKI